MTTSEREIWNAAIDAAAAAIAAKCGLLAPYKFAQSAVRSVKKGPNDE